MVLCLFQVVSWVGLSSVIVTFLVILIYLMEYFDQALHYSILEDLENASQYSCTFLQTVYAIEKLLAGFNVQPRIGMISL